MNYYYSFNCIDSNAETIQGIIDRAEQIDHATIEAAIGKTALLSFSHRVLGYDNHLRMADDYCVTYHRSTYDYRTCYYVRWSAIEHVFLARRDWSVRGAA